MDPTQDLGLPYTDSHARKSSVQLVQEIALLCAPLRDDGALRATVNECLHRTAIDLSVDVEHRYVAEKFRIFLHGCLVLCLDHLLPNLLFNHLLCLSVVGVSVVQAYHALLLCLLPIHLLL